MVNKRVNPIVAERDDMIGRSIPDSRGDKPASGGGSSNGRSSAADAGIPGLWKSMILIAFLGLAGAGGFGLAAVSNTGGQAQ